MGGIPPQGVHPVWQGRQKWAEKRGAEAPQVFVTEVTSDPYLNTATA